MKIHFIGIGGIGTSALAQYYLSEGHQVSGSDLATSEITEFLKAKGVEIVIGQKAENISADFDLVVYSPAVPGTNEELKESRAQKIKTITYPEALGQLTEDHFTIAVAGSHGKSTTTAMVALILEKAGLDPTVIIGTKLKEFGNSNFRKGGGEYLVIEACEYDGSFSNYEPNITIITNVDKEHLDYFKTYENVIKQFGEFARQLPADGTLILCDDDDGNKKLDLAAVPFEIITYSINQPEADQVKKLLQVPGNHNLSNALAAMEAARCVGAEDEVIFSALSKFAGTWRRFEVREVSISRKAVTLVSDYGHHPNEVAATLQAAREKYADKKITVIFQPHQYQRTFYLYEDFVKVIKGAPVDELVITDIYDVAGRETAENHDKVSSQKLAESVNMPSVRYVPKAELDKELEKLSEGDVLVVMGAGDIYKFAEKL